MRHHDPRERGVFVTRVSFGATLNLTEEFYSGDWRRLQTLVSHAETIGFESAFIMDHLTGYDAWVEDNSKTSSSSDYYECWTSISAMAATTKKIRVGPLVGCVGYRNPALLAKMATTVDRISEGRLNFSIGAGWKRDEHLAYGYPFPTPAARVRQMDEALTIIKSMWTRNRTTFAGKYFSVNEVELGPKSVQKPHPPIWIGGGGEQLLLKAVARHADVWDVWCNPEQYSRKLDVLKEHCKSVGRDAGQIGLSVSPEVFIDKDGQNALKKARSQIWPNADEKAFLDRRIVGSPEQCIEQISTWVDLGVRYFTPMTHTMPGPDLDLFAERVMPHFR